MQKSVYLNGDNQKIFDYFSRNNLEDFKKAFLELIKKGYKIDKKQIKNILRLIRQNDLEILKDFFSALFVQENIFLAADPVIKKSSYPRLKKYRARAKEKGLKNLSVLVSHDDHKKLQDLKRQKGMTNAQVLSFLLSLA